MVETEELINEALAKSMTFALMKAKETDPERFEAFMDAICIIDDFADAIYDEKVTPEEAKEILTQIRKGGAIEAFLKMLLAEVGIKI